MADFLQMLHVFFPFKQYTLTVATSSLETSEQKQEAKPGLGLKLLRSKWLFVLNANANAIAIR